MRCVIADRKVTIGSAALPVAPWIVTTAMPGEPTLYCVGDGLSDTTMCWSGWITLLLIVSSVTRRRRLTGRASRSTGSTVR